MSCTDKGNIALPQQQGGEGANTPNQSEIVTKTKALKCSSWSNSSDQPLFFDCDTKNMVKDTSHPFYNEIIKMKKNNDKFVFLTKTISNLSPNGTALYDAKLMAYRDLNIWDTKKKTSIAIIKNESVMDFTVQNNKIYALWHSSKRKAQLSIFNLAGKELYNSYLIDPQKQSDDCTESPNNSCHDDIDWDESAELRHIWFHSMPFSGVNFRREGQIQVSKTGQIYMYINTNSRSSGNLYGYNLDNENNLSFSFKKQILKNLGKIEAPNIVLTGGTELFAFNRYAKVRRKDLLLLEDGNFLLTATIAADYADELDIDFSFLQKQHSSIDFLENGVPLIVVMKLGPMGETIFKNAISATDWSGSTFTAPNIWGNKVVITHTRRKKATSSSSIYSSRAIVVNLKTGLMESEIPLEVFNNNGTMATISEASVIDESTGDLYITGATAWTQNPTGASISNSALAFIAKINLTSKAQQTKYFMYSNRKEVGTNLVLDPQQGETPAIYMGLSFDGPGTHSGDKNISQAYQKSAIIRVE
jgi:hypothetical protein